MCFNNIVNIANACVNLGHWPSHFKLLSSIIIPKPNKASYNFSKIFCLIVLLNTLGKLIEKVIGERLQFQSTSKNFIHHNQLRRLKQHLTIDTDNFLTHLICSGWVKNLQTSILVFKIAQFFPLLNRQLPFLILDKAGFNPKFSSFFSDYLVGRNIQYLWNNFVFPFFNIDVGVGQDSTLSPFFFCSLSLAYFSHF